jgi:hypothetical protein
MQKSAEYRRGDTMRTTLDLDDDIVARAKARAAIERTTLTRLVEQGLILRLESADASSQTESVQIPAPIAGLGRMRLEAAKLTSYGALLDLMEEVDQE